MLDVADRATQQRAATNEGPPTPSMSVNAWSPHSIVMQDAWFPLAHSFAVGQKPVRRAIYSHPYFLWRENGSPVASEFHPNEQRLRDKSRHTDADARYPVMEKYGFVWGWFGRPEAADPVHLPSLPFLPPNGGLPKYMLGTVRFDCAAPLSLENLIDLTHADFLHADVVGDEKSESETIETFHTSETVTMVRNCKAKSVAPVMKFFSGIRSPVQDVRQVIHIYLRSHCAIAYGRFTPGDDVPLFHPCVPETRDRTRLDYAMNTSNAGFMFRHVMPKASYKVSRQDSSMTSPQSPRYMRPTSRRDLHSPLDAPGQRYRMAMQELAARQEAGDFTYRDNVSADCSELIGLRRELFNF
ncbi:MAG TPA: aromatic ring-hydroxylating dioxygenase subunit alpha [Steroidobacteraceae bacterium]|nr:aromatic ring-hydroxylating dioxygenase subunit alpha [Steroidobacteraceae bacterium]